MTSPQEKLCITPNCGQRVLGTTGGVERCTACQQILDKTFYLPATPATTPNHNSQPNHNSRHANSPNHYVSAPSTGPPSHATFYLPFSSAEYATFYLPIPNCHWKSCSSYRRKSCAHSPCSTQTNTKEGSLL